jgi:hypothetical protein
MANGSGGEEAWHLVVTSFDVTQLAVCIFATDSSSAVNQSQAHINLGTCCVFNSFLIFTRSVNVHIMLLILATFVFCILCL